MGGAPGAKKPWPEKFTYKKPYFLPDQKYGISSFSELFFLFKRMIFYPNHAGLILPSANMLKQNNKRHENNMARYLLAKVVTASHINDTEATGDTLAPEPLPQSHEADS